MYFLQFKRIIQINKWPSGITNGIFIPYARLGWVEPNVHDHYVSQFGSGIAMGNGGPDPHSGSDPSWD